MHKRPEYLQHGNKVVIIAPAGRIKEGGLDQAIIELESWGLEVEITAHALNGHHYFSASDQDRLNDLQNAIDSIEYKTIFCARGGYGLTRIIDHVDFSALKMHSKWIIGFSDVTALHLALSGHGLQSIHSIMPTGFELADQASVQSLQKVLFGKNVVLEAGAHKHNRYGKTAAPVVGGNLSLLAASIGTKYELKSSGKILFIEEIDEYLYKVDRMIGQLGRSGKLKNLKGLVIGHMSGMKDTTIPFGTNTAQLIFDHVSQYDYPVLFDVPVGHEALNLPVVHEGKYQLEVNENGGVLRMI